MKWSQHNLFDFSRVEPGCILINRLVPGSVFFFYLIFINIVELSTTAILGKKKVAVVE